VYQEQLEFLMNSEFRSKFGTAPFPQSRLTIGIDLEDVWSHAACTQQQKQQYSEGSTKNRS
jgi:hypothetical protein